MKTEKLLIELELAKVEEKAAIAHRVKLEEKVFKNLEESLTKREGQESFEIGEYKVTVNRPVYYKLDDEKYRILAGSLSEDKQFHRVKLELDKVKYDQVLKSVDKNMSILIHECVVATPGKISIGLKKL